MFFTKMNCLQIQIKDRIDFGNKDKKYQRLKKKLYLTWQFEEVNNNYIGQITNTSKGSMQFIKYIFKNNKYAYSKTSYNK